MTETFVDTGPLVAWLDRRDGDHALVAAFLKEFNEPLLTAWPMLTEVCHLLPQRCQGTWAGLTQFSTARAG